MSHIRTALRKRVRQAERVETNESCVTFSAGLLKKRWVFSPPPEGKLRVWFALHLLRLEVVTKWCAIQSAAVMLQFAADVYLTCSVIARSEVYACRTNCVVCSLLADSLCLLHGELSAVLLYTVTDGSFASISYPSISCKNNIYSIRKSFVLFQLLEKAV